jgi:hypothetical protein
MEFVPIRSDELYRHAWFVSRKYQIPSIDVALCFALADLHATSRWAADQR